MSFYCLPRSFGDEKEDGKLNEIAQSSLTPNHTVDFNSQGTRCKESFGR